MLKKRGKAMAQLWGGRFTKETDKLVYNFNASISFDKRFYEQDIQGSKAHVMMLAKQGILTDDEKQQILDGLESIRKDVENGKLEITEEYEDIHSFVEANLIDRIGDAGKKLHTGRSRNDQGGHNDTLAGFLITNREDIQEQLRFIIKTTGATLAPMDSWLILRGIKTLGVRMDRAQENALKIAHFLEKQEYVTRVLYPGLESHPGYELMKKQARGFGSILTFEVDSKERAYHILENVKLIQFAESLGGTETLITYPITQTHADLSKEELDRNGITDRILRLSVGIEGAEDLIADLEAVLK